ncbi:MAG: hypothetical protein ACFCVD_16870, partial [Nodosilinea sp.]
GQFLMANDRMRVSGLFRSSLADEKPRVSALAQKSVRAIVRQFLGKKIPDINRLLDWVPACARMTR